MISQTEHYGDYTVVLITDTGISHQTGNKQNQDAVGFTSIGDDYVVAVSDGVGSCKMAELGSNAAVAAAKNVFSTIKANNLAMEITEIVNQLVLEWKGLLQYNNPDDCCATLKAAMKFGNKMMLFSIGDGLLSVSSGELQITAPQDSCFFSNQTMCLHSAVMGSDFWTSVFSLDLSIPYVVFACTDGVSNGIREGREMDLVRNIETEIPGDQLRKELEDLVEELSDYSSDDKTVGVVKYERTNAESDR